MNTFMYSYQKNTPESYIITFFVVACSSKYQKLMKHCTCVGINFSPFGYNSL